MDWRRDGTSPTRTMHPQDVLFVSHRLTICHLSQHRRRQGVWVPRCHPRRQIQPPCGDFWFLPSHVVTLTVLLSRQQSHAVLWEAIRQEPNQMPAKTRTLAHVLSEPIYLLSSAAMKGFQDLSSTSFFMALIRVASCRTALCGGQVDGGWNSCILRSFNRCSQST